MEPAATSIQVLLQAAEFLERRERGAAGARYPPCLAEAEHGYASLCPARSRRAGGSGRRGRPCRRLGPGRRAPSGNRAAHLGTPQGLEEQELRARRAKDRLRNRQWSLRRQLELLLSPIGGERARADSLDSSQLSEPSEGGERGERGRAGKGRPSGPDPASPRCPEDAEIEVDGAVFSGDLLPGFGTGRDHSYSSPCSPAS
ncbi:MAD3 protein, partial [Nyctibius bracteatus]|nr:MAD3 protein [Nyctibius bracteatus]